MNAIQLSWIEKGYQIFAYEGPGGLKVERLAKAVGKNKSSFYHFFADLELFISDLLDFHLERAELMAEKEANAANLKDLIGVILEFKIDLLFNRQLRVHRENAEFARCFTQTNQITISSIMGVWSKVLDLKPNSHLSKLLLQLSLENFFLQITDETLNYDWLNNYFQQLRVLVREFKKTGTMPALDGSV